LLILRWWYFEISFAVTVNNARPHRRNQTSANQTSDIQVLRSVLHSTHDNANPCWRHAPEKTVRRIMQDCIEEIRHQQIRHQTFRLSAVSSIAPMIMQIPAGETLRRNQLEE
jgi:hypothetical protein